MRIKQMIELIKNKKLFIYCILLMVPLIFLDQYTKLSIYNKFNDLIAKTANPYLHFKITSFLNIVLVLNKGVAFGVFNGDFFVKFMPNILTLVTTAIVVVLTYQLWKKQNRTTFPFIFIIAGGVGNLIDRIRIGAVIDFIDFHIKNYHWPAFNIADSLIFIGGVMYLVVDFLINKAKH